MFATRLTGISHPTSGHFSHYFQESHFCSDAEGSQSRTSGVDGPSTGDRPRQFEMVINNSWAITASDNTGKDTFTWAAGTYGGLGTEGQKNVWVAQSVPEPTSGLLLLLGMAGLALKRRRT